MPIVFDPPAALPFIPSTQKLARVELVSQRDTFRGTQRLQILLIDADGKQISPDADHMPASVVTPAQASAVPTSPVGIDKDTPDQATFRAVLPLVHAMLGITGGTVK
jgi:hypothetical protein